MTDLDNSGASQGNEHSVKRLIKMFQEGQGSNGIVNPETYVKTTIQAKKGELGNFCVNVMKSYDVSDFLDSQLREAVYTAARMELSDSYKDGVCGGDCWDSSVLKSLFVLLFKKNRVGILSLLEELFPIWDIDEECGPEAWANHWEFFLNLLESVKEMDVSILESILESTVNLSVQEALPIFTREQGKRKIDQKRNGGELNKHDQEKRNAFEETFIDWNPSDQTNIDDEAYKYSREFNHKTKPPISKETLAKADSGCRVFLRAKQLAYEILENLHKKP